MGKGKTSLSVFILLLFSATIGRTQISFQKTFDIPSFENDRAILLSDGGYAIGGGNNSNSSELSLLKLNCEAEPEWFITFAESMEPVLGDVRVIETDDEHLIVAGTAYVSETNPSDIFIAKLQLNGNLIWKRRYGGQGRDVLGDLSNTNDGKLVFVGHTSSIGSDAGSEFHDILLFKTDLSGNLEWSKSFGNEEQYEKATAITEHADGGLSFCGNIGSDEMGTESAALVIKTDVSGNFSWARSFGLEEKVFEFNDILAIENSVFAVGKAQSQEDLPGDPERMFIAQMLQGNGTLVGTSSIQSTGEDSDVATTIITGPGGSLLIAADCESYSTFNTGTSPSKHAIFQTNISLELQSAYLLNGGNSNKTHVDYSEDGKVLISGLSSLYSGDSENSETLLIRTEDDLQSGCFQNEILALSSIIELSPNSEEVFLTEDTGISGLESGGSTVLEIPTLNTICEQFPPFDVDFDPPSTCLGQSIDLISQTTGDIAFIEWNLGNNDSEEMESLNYTYSLPGAYEVTLFATDGCQAETVTGIVNIYEAPEIDPGPELTINEGENVTLGGNPTGQSNWTYVWNQPQLLTDEFSPNPIASPQDSITFLLTVTDEFGCTAEGEQIINIIPFDVPEDEPIIEGEVFIPNIFSPNGDELNDEFKVFGGPFLEYKLEVFNRLGQRIFLSEDQKLTWDGMFGGEKAPTAVYFYQFTGRDINNLPVSEAGNISLIR